jgi:glyoxylase-like metal-dependent hydrolase (beta-lactamase superfamily II)
VIQGTGAIMRRFRGRRPTPAATLMRMASTLRLREIVPNVWVARSRRYESATTVLLDGYGGALVIDPNWDADELAAIPEDLAALGVTCVAGLATHLHYDHVMWHPDLGDVPRWATPGTVRVVTDHREDVLRPLLGDIPDDLIAIAGHLTPIRGDTLDWRGPRAIVHEHDAHAVHHLALEIPDWGLLVSGDMLSDAELPYPDDDDVDLVTYRTGLDSLRDVVSRTRVIVPGHGTSGEDAQRRWDADRRYLDDVVERGTSDDPRIGNPEQPEMHAANVRRAKATPR